MGFNAMPKARYFGRTGRNAFGGIASFHLGHCKGETKVMNIG